MSVEGGQEDEATLKTWLHLSAKQEEAGITAKLQSVPEKEFE